MRIPGWAQQERKAQDTRALIVHLFLTQEEEETPYHHEDNLFTMARTTERVLKEAVVGMVKDDLGPGFEVTSLTYSAGSLHYVIIIAFAFSAYEAISRYKSFTESVQLLVRHLKSLTQELFLRKGMRVRISDKWELRPALMQHENGPRDWMGVILALAVLHCLVLMSLVLLCALLCLFIILIRIGRM